VTLAPGPLQHQFEDNHRLFRDLNEDGLLKPFRQRVGLPAPGPDMAVGTITLRTSVPLTAAFTDSFQAIALDTMCRFCRASTSATGDSATRQKVSRLVKGYAQTITSSGRFYVDYHLPAYTYDKMVCGLIDAHEFAHDTLALAVFKHAIDELLAHLPEKALTRPEQGARPHKDIAYTWDETYTLPENQFLAWRRSGDERYRQLAIVFF